MPKKNRMLAQLEAKLEIKYAIAFEVRYGYEKNP